MNEPIKILQCLERIRRVKANPHVERIDVGATSVTLTYSKGRVQIIDYLTDMDRVIWLKTLDS